MPRSNPNEVSSNPAQRWFLWDGSKGNIKYYDKESESEIRIELPFEFILLDRLSVIRGWHDASESGIYSNEVRRTMDEPFTVRAFKMKEVIAQGFYADIKDKIKASGGKYNASLYIAFTDDSGELSIGNLMLHGGAMSAWLEFEKANKKEIFTKGIKITDFTEGKKGGIKFRVPVLELVEIDYELDAKAEELQKELQKHLVRYLSRKTETKTEEAEYEPETWTSDDEDEMPF